MNDRKVNTDLLALQQQGLIDNRVTSDQTINSDNQPDSPWFIQLLLGFSGLFASLFFLGFLSLLLFETRVFDSFIGLSIVGLLLSAVGFVLFRNKNARHNSFLNSLAFAISVAGQVYVALALEDSYFSHPLNVWLFLVIQIFLTIVVPNFIYRLFSTVVALGCMVYLLGYYQVTEAGLALLALITIIAHLQRYSMLRSIATKWRLAALELNKAVGYASTFMLLVFSTYIVAGEFGNGFNYYYSDDYQYFSYNYILAQVLLILVSLYAVYLILQRYNIKPLAPTSLIIACAIIVLGVISVYVSGLLATSLVIIIAMANSQRILLGVGILALVGYIFWYYYQLDTSLLVKSASMLIIGVIVLLMRWLLVSRYFAKAAFPSPKPVPISDKENSINSKGNAR